MSLPIYSCHVGNGFGVILVVVAHGRNVSLTPEQPEALNASDKNRGAEALGDIPGRTWNNGDSLPMHCHHRCQHALRPRH